MILTWIGDDEVMWSTTPWRTWNLEYEALESYNMHGGKEGRQEWAATHILKAHFIACIM
jgi:hypothetical protein